MNKRVGIVGFGRFGFLATAILSKHFEVSVWDISRSQEVFSKAKKAGAEFSDLKKVASSDIVILSVPISQTENIIKKISPFIADGSLVLDTCSVKVLPCRWMNDYIKNKRVEIVGTHPMFGPVTTKFDLKKMTWNLMGLQVVVCPVRSKKETLENIKSFLKKLGLNVIEATPEEHDRQNAYTLGLVHLLGRALMASGAKSQKIFTPGYVDLLKIIPHTASDNWQLFFDMHNFNPYSENIRKKFYSSCADLEKKILISAEKK